jgi:hypothetical protein
MIAGIIYAPSGTDGELLLREMAETLRSVRVEWVAIVTGNGKAFGWFDGPVIRGEGTGALLAAMRVFPQEDLHGLLCCPADGPKLSQHLIVDLLQGFWRSGKQIILPSEGWRPVIIGSRLMAELAGGESLEQFCRSHPSELYRVAHPAPVSLQGDRA